MKRIFFLAIPAVVLTASVALGNDGRLEAARAKYSLIDSLRFNENDLAKLERVRLTGGTTLRRGIAESAATGAAKPTVRGPQPQWFEHTTQMDTFNEDANLKAPEIGISTPLVRIDDRAIDTSDLVISEPVSVASLAALGGPSVVDRRVRK